MHKKLKLLLPAALLATALSAGTAQAATRTTLRYDIAALWLDADDLYVIYTRQKTKMHYSLTDIHGTVLSEEKRAYLLRMPRSGLQDGTKMKLEGGEDASGLLYRDREFSVTASAGEVKVAAGGSLTTVPECAERTWVAPAVMRAHDHLVYCGARYGPTGKRVEQAPQAMVAAYQSAAKGQAWPFSLVPMSALTEDKLLTVFANPGSAVAALDVAVWPLAGQGEVRWVKLALPPVAGDYKLQTYNVWSPAAFVVRPKDAKQLWALLCGEEKCERIEVHSGYTFVSSLAVDQARRQIIELESYGEPAATVHISRY